MRWFKNLKKWQKGGLIGCAVGVIFAGTILLSPTYHSLGEWVHNFHDMCYWLPTGIALIGWGETSTGDAIVKYGGFVAIVIFYGALGMLFGRVQQIANSSQKWLLTALLALFLLGFYAMSYNSNLFY